MDLALMSLLALVVAITVSCTTKINVGILSMALAWIVGVHVGGLPLDEIIAGFPSQLFLTLLGVTLLFTLARVNGTLDKVAHHAVRSCRGSLVLIPIMFFGLAWAFASIGPGSIASAALIGPIAMAVAGRTGIAAFLMAIMVANGSSAGSLSPFGPTGIVVNDLMAKVGLVDVQWQNFLYVMLAHTTVGFAGYFVFGGWRLFGRTFTEARGPLDRAAGDLNAHDVAPDRALEWTHWLTLAVISVLIATVLIFEINVGMGALCGAVLLIVLRAADEAVAVRTMPWTPILMVCGVTVLVSLTQKTGGMDVFSTLLASASSLETITAFTAFVTGAISIFSSTAGVVLPAFLPTIPGIITKLGGGDAMAIASSMSIGAHLVDVSPLSTTGALMIAAAPVATDTRQMFRWMLAWGLSMTVVAAVGCYVVFGILW